VVVTRRGEGGHLPVPVAVPVDYPECRRVDRLWTTKSDSTHAARSQLTEISDKSGERFVHPERVGPQEFAAGRGGNMMGRPPEGSDGETTP
jgi:hypothetical protein